MSLDSENIDKYRYVKQDVPSQAQENDEEDEDEEADEFSLMADMTKSQRILFQTQMNDVRKSRTTAFVLTFFLGGFGAHHFYLGRIGLGVLYAIFIWTGIPSIIGIIELFFIGERVDTYNQEKALEIADKVKSLG